MGVLAVVRLARVARGVHPVPHIDAAAAPPPVRDLADHRHVVAVHRLAELFQVGDDAIVEHLDSVPVAGCARGMHACRAEAHHEPGSTASLLLVVAALHLVRHPVPRERVGVPAAADAVLDRAVPDPDRCEKVFEFRHVPT